MKAFNVNIGHARSACPAAAGYVRGRGRHAPGPGPDGIRRPVDGRPCRTGGEG